MGPGSDDGGRLADALASAGPGRGSRGRAPDGTSQVRVVRGRALFRFVRSCSISRRAGLVNRSRKVLEPRWHCASRREKLQQPVARSVWNVDDEAALRFVVPALLK